MEYKKIRLQMEKQISQEIYELLEGKIVEKLLKEAKVEKIEAEWKNIIEGHSFKISQKLTPESYAIFQEVLKKLEFKEKVDLYITQSGDINAFSIASLEKDQPHIIMINSSLFERMNDKELRFVLGHEMGHIISKNARKMKLFNFVFPTRDDIPVLLLHKYRLWNQLTELTADRFGYLVMPEFEICLSAFFKLSSGLDTKMVNLNTAEYYKQNEEILQNFIDKKAINISTHPINPLRLKALKVFSESQLFADIAEDREAAKDEELKKKVAELCEMLTLVTGSEYDQKMLQFFAAGGLIMSQVDEKVTDKEYEYILNILSHYIMFPREFMQYMYKESDYRKIFDKSLVVLLKMNPANRAILFDYLISIALIDKDIEEVEINKLYEIGTSKFGFNRKEIAQKIANQIRKKFVPDIYK